LNLNEIMVWEWPVAAYLFLGGAGAGAMLVAVAIRTLRRTVYDPVAIAGAALAGPTLAAGTALLILDLGVGRWEPWRLIYLYTHTSSVMMWGTWIITVFIPVALLYAGAISAWRPRWKPGATLLEWAANHEVHLRAISAALAAGTAIYTGFLLFEAGQGFPVWRTVALPLLFFVSALSTGLSAAVIIGRWWVPGGERSMHPMMRAHLTLIVAELAALAAWLQTTSASDAGRAAAHNVFAGSLAPLFWGGVVFVGLVWPILSHIYAHNGGRLGQHLVVSGDGGVLVGGYCLRVLVLAAAVPTLARQL